MPNSDFLHNNKAFRPIIGKGYPKKSEGIDGDFSLRQSNEGLKLFVKFGGDWYFVAQLIATGVNNLALGGHPTSLAASSGSIGANKGSNKAGVPMGSKFSFDSNAGRSLARNTPANETYIQYSSEGGPTRNSLAKNHVKFNVAARPLLFMIEDGSSSRMLAGSNSLPAGIEAKAFYISGTYGAGLGTTKILGGSNQMQFFCNAVTMATFSDAGVDFNDKDLTNIDSLDADKFSIAGGTEMVAINDEDDMSSNSNTALATQQSIKAYTDAANKWSASFHGRVLNITSTSNFYTINTSAVGNLWSTTSTDPTALASIIVRAAKWIAPAAGTLTNIRISGSTADTGANDSFKFYVYKAPLTQGNSSNTGTLIGTSSAITSASARTLFQSDDFSSSNTFAEGDAIFVFLKKDANSGSQDIFFNITISGLHTA